MLATLQSKFQRNRALAMASVWYLSERIVNSALSFGVFFVLAKVYGPADFGVWNYALSVMQMAAGFLAATAEPIVVRELVTHRAKQGVVLGSAAVVVACSSLLVLGLPLAYLAATHPVKSDVVQIAGLMALSYVPNFFLVIEHFFRAHNNALPVVRVRLLVGLLGSGVRIGLALAGLPIEAVAWALPLEAVLMGGFLLWSDRTTLYRMPRWSVERHWVALIAKACWPAMVASTVVTVFFRISHVILERLSTFAEVGLYAFGFSLLQLVASLPNILVSTLYPRLVDVYNADRPKFFNQLRWLFFGSSVFGWLSVVVTSLTASSVIPHFFGAKYEGAVLPTIIIFLGLPVLASGAVRAAAINISGQQKIHLTSTVLGLGVLLPGLFVLVPRYGAAGAAAAVVGGNLVSAVLSSFVFRGTQPYARDQLQGFFLLTPFVHRWRTEPLAPFSPEMSP